MQRNKLSFSPSKLEQFRKFYHEEYNGTVTPQKVIESIMGKVPWKQEMTTGSAYHLIIENGGEPYWSDKENKYVVFDKESKETVLFTKNEAEPAIIYRNAHPGLIFEVPNKWTFNLNGFEITMNMRFDAGYGLDIHEHKTVYKSGWHIETYEDSLQWKIYLLSSAARKVKYNIFEYIKYENDDEGRVTHVAFDLHPYPNMKDDIFEQVELFINFCYDNNLMEYVYAKGR